VDLHDSSAAEEAILAVLAGTPIKDAAAWVYASPGRLAEAIELYRTAGRAALDARHGPDWYQAYLEFADYPTADRVFGTYLLPLLKEANGAGFVGAWWFVRKYPCWRLRVAPGPETALEDLVAPVADALDDMVSWGVARRWWSSPYEPETAAFGGPEGMNIAHDLFHADSIGALDYLHRTATDARGLLDAKATSFLVVSLFLRAAGQEWGEQGDVWARVEASRPLRDDVPVERVAAMTGTLRKLLAIDAGPLLAAGSPLVPLTEWVAGMERAGQALDDAGRNGRLSLGTRGILARHVLFHWNRMGFTTRQQAIWARAARETILGS
jgi:thiopeptide-type bacteriocin biosynthesis protein